MLQQINIKNFAIIENLELELPQGMTVITGETGAGKSIVIDALDIALGDRADSSMIRHGCERCEINLSFDVSKIPPALAWLQQQDLLDNDKDCLIRRVTAKEGRSKNYINGSSVTLQQLRELGERLVHVHGQHQHHGLLKREQQRMLLDHYMNQPALIKKVTKLFQQLKQVQQKIQQLQQQGGQHDAQVELWRYQVEELDELGLQLEEIQQLPEEHQQLANAENIIQQCQQALTALTENPDDAIVSQLNNLIHGLSQLELTAMHPIQQLLQNAVIEIEEAVSELKQLHGNVDINGERLQWVENRLSSIHDLARKHKVKPEQLPQQHENLRQQIAAVTNADEQLQLARQQEQEILQQYNQAAQQLSQRRQQAADELSALISNSLQTLGMPNGQFTIRFNCQDQPTVHGLDLIDFMVTANPGQPLQLLSKVASGGELSRISLAIQVISAQNHTTPTLVFDEVDVGIGGGTAEIVGQLLRQLGQSAQVLCITHLPQVAAQGHHHLLIHKAREQENTISHLTWLQEKTRVEELARMLGGVKITKQTRAHAEEMLAISI